MSTADAEGLVIEAKIINTWSWIHHEALKVSRNCIGKKLGGGLVLISGIRFSPVFWISKPDS